MTKRRNCGSYRPRWPCEVERLLRKGNGLINTIPIEWSEDVDSESESERDFRRMAISAKAGCWLFVFCLLSVFDCGILGDFDMLLRGVLSVNMDIPCNTRLLYTSNSCLGFVSDGQDYSYDQDLADAISTST